MATEKWQDVLVALRQIIRATDLHSKKLVREYGLTTPQILVLKAAHELKMVTIRTISENVALSQATVTTILNRLEQKGLVVRERSDKDKRAVHVNLTKAGLTALLDAPSLLHENFISKFEGLADWEQNQILSSLQRVATMMEAEDLDAAPLLDVGAPDKSDD